MAIQAPAAAQFPTSIWDGTTPSRTETMRRSPDHADFEQLKVELIATQTDLKAIDGDNPRALPNGSGIGGIPVVHRVDIGDAAGDTDVTLTYKTRVTDVHVVKTGANGGSGDLVTVKNGSTAISDAMNLNVNDQVIVRALSINDASHEIAAGGTLRVTAAKATNPSCIVYVHGIRVT